MAAVISFDEAEFRHQVRQPFPPLVIYWQMGWSWEPHGSPKNIHAFLDHNINPLPVFSILYHSASLQLLGICVVFSAIYRHMRGKASQPVSSLTCISPLAYPSAFCLRL
jgi:hypothetical protein